MTLAQHSFEPALEWPEMPDDTRWTLDRAAAMLTEVLTSHPMELPTSFQFRWRSGRYQIDIERADGEVQLRLSGVVGTVPFTSEDRSSRNRVLDTLRHLRDAWPCAGLTLMGGQVRLRRDLSYVEPVSFREMIAEATSALLPVQPVIELIESDLWPAR